MLRETKVCLFIYLSCQVKDVGKSYTQEGLEALVEEAAAKSSGARNSSKRSRAAEVHNLSEKVGFLV